MSDNKCVIVIDQDLPVGTIANTAAVLSLTLGMRCPFLIGEDLVDSEGRLHLGITTVPIPILKATAKSLKDMREALMAFEPALTVVDLTSATQTTRSYGEYAEHLGHTPVDRIDYLGLALYGDKKQVNKWTGSLGLLR